MFVTVIDSVTKLPLEGVLISLSGHSYRNNTLSNDNGSIVFLSLSPGSYYLRPMLKEYLFEPLQASLIIEEGTQENVTISAIRVKYSCFGKVISLNHQVHCFN